MGVYMHQFFILKNFVLPAVLILSQSTPSATSSHPSWSKERIAMFRAGFGGRIIGGKTTEISQFPYQVSIEYIGRHDCGGALISTTHVLTAAHCGMGRSPEQLGVRAGSSTRSFGGFLRAVIYIGTHPEFDRKKIHNDIAILKLEDFIPITYMTQPIMLAPPGMYWPPGFPAIVTGWGASRENQSADEIPYQLQFVNLQVKSLDVCASEFTTTVITDHMICVGSDDLEAKDSCQGDSGGPLVIGGVLAGIVSFGIGCGRPGLSAIYTNVSAYRDFIDSMMAML